MMKKKAKVLFLKERENKFEELIKSVLSKVV